MLIKNPLRLCVIEFQEERSAIGVSRVVMIIRNKLIPSIPTL